VFWGVEGENQCEEARGFSPIKESKAYCTMKLIPPNYVSLSIDIFLILVHFLSNDSVTS